MTMWSDASARVRELEPLAEKTTWKIGGRARYYAEPATMTELSSLLADAERDGLRVYVLGGGSNLLVTDGVLDGLVIRLDETGAFGAMAVDSEGVGMTAGAAAPLPGFCRTAAEQGLSGVENLAGIPGRVGGATVMNAGSASVGIGIVVAEVEGVDKTGRLVRFARDQIHFAYRWSNLDGVIVTSVRFALKPGNPEDIRAAMKGAIELKRKHQPLDFPSAGCVFKNPRERPAGLLIEQAGLKGYRIGGAAVSDLHANFIVNAGGATCDDVRRVIDHVRETVRQTQGLELKLEVCLWL